MPKFILRTLDHHPLSRVQLLCEKTLVVEITQPAESVSRDEFIVPQEYDGPGGGWCDEEVGDCTPSFDNDR